MRKLLQEVRAAVDAEYKRAAAKFGTANNSPHESYAVILEEFEEAVEKTDLLKMYLDSFWKAVRANDTETAGRWLCAMQKYAIEAAAEMIQTAAMCYKATVPKEEA